MKLQASFAALILGLLGFALPASSIFQSPAVATIDASSTKGDQLMVCVDWTTKEIKYSKHWETCPSKHQNIMLGVEGPQGETGPQGPRGYSGSSGSSTTMWNSLSTCYQKLQAALQAGFIMALKSDRDFFENATGCVVEEISNTSRAAIAAAAGLPYISSFAFAGWTEQGGSEGGDNIYQNTQYATANFNLTIENGDAISAVNPLVRLCNARSYGYGALLTPLGGKNYTVPVSVAAGYFSLTAELNLGTSGMGNPNSCLPLFNSWDGGSPEILIHVDPALATPVEFDEKLAGWGW